MVFDLRDLRAFSDAKAKRKIAKLEVAAFDANGVKLDDAALAQLCLKPISDPRELTPKSSPQLRAESIELPEDDADVMGDDRYALFCWGTWEFGDHADQGLTGVYTHPVNGPQTRSDLAATYADDSDYTWWAIIYDIVTTVGATSTVPVDVVLTTNGTASSPKTVTVWDV